MVILDSSAFLDEKGLVAVLREKVARKLQEKSSSTNVIDYVTDEVIDYIQWWYKEDSKWKKLEAIKFLSDLTRISKSKDPIVIEKKELPKIKSNIDWWNLF